ncbi:Histone-fold [Arabidopsis thaliana x Arabidopsis arenosa]|uniref:Histone-fold n=1 Tax=Arabidopsis thaliana x Arabidopsis arenosa TaxID=1240361 RepID=A0A8T1YCR0_9BRAS|nr:Histone-fold [Arabidopsis thaliana x Arabidopsis arenosa]KAG7543725.1 Histone-fold [Arabidopsis thaliana x Arabidopsis arenosa]
MVRPIVATSSVNPNPTVEESFVMMEPSEHYVNSVRQIHDQSTLVCPMDQERHLLNQDLVKFWAHHNSIGLHDKLDLPLARIKKVMKSDPQVKMVSSDSHVLLAKACDIFIEEVALRAWRNTQSCSRNTIQSCDIYKALKESVIYDELTDLVSFGQHSVTHQGVPQDVVQQQLFPSANVNVPEMKDPIDIDKIQQQCLYFRTTEHFIDTGEFEIDPKYQ